MTNGLEVESFRKNVASAMEMEGKSRLRFEKLLKIVHFFINKKSEDYNSTLALLDKLIKKRKDIVSKIKLIESNAAIYENNLNKLNLLIDGKDKDIKNLKGDYASMMNVPLGEIDKGDATLASDLSDEENIKLIKEKREKLLGSMNSMFEGFEKKIDKSASIKRNLIKKREELSSRLETAKMQSKILFIAYDSNKNEILRKKKKKNKEARELKSLIKVNKIILKKINKALTLGEESRLVIMHSFLSLSEEEHR
jgi:hypothetical protein